MKKYTLLLLLLLFATASTQAADRVALVIGNNAYSSAPLYKARSDAQAIGDVLSNIGFDVVRSYDANRTAMDNALSEFGQKASRAKIAVVYYAGHAIQVDGKNYLVPAHTEVKRQGDLRKLIDLNDLLIEAKQAKGLGLVLLDACRNNPFASRLSSSLGRAIRGRGLARVESTPTNVLISFATQENNIAPDESQYAKALLKYLPQSNLEVRMLMGSIRDEVMETTGNKQQPHVYGTLGRKAWYLTSGSQTKPQTITDQSTTNPTPLRIVQGNTKQSIEPDMVKIQGGTYAIGCLSGKDCDDDETVHKVTVNNFWMARTEVTVKEYRHCVNAGACQQAAWQETGNDNNIHTGSNNHYKKLGKALTGDNYPIVGVSWHNAVQYAQWLTQKTGKPYRLPTEAEWEIAARGGSKTQYPWGNAIGNNKANCDSKCGDKHKYSSPVASFAAYQGLYDMIGNVWEWTCSAYPKGGAYEGSETQCANGNDSRSRVLRGGSWNDVPWIVRSANRNRNAASVRSLNFGFRLSRTR